ncbi:protein-glutamate O-methyltransferase CheR [Halovulum dunhuangense]|uniref:Chemotaxis protein methyltransferase n=1 Tax=Halovulum dunhuangense TaxID=1505036 RepID=A0A849KV09_9RHOB|nr:protein-glutamate O-methyltransferase CheR [Halovulum dunhuangense]NNU79188.1 protein-glutamate O-methyltransferase CheR [Halovulum dunhuangense]
MTDRDFARIAERIARMAGIVLEEHKRQMIHSRLSRRLRALGMGSFTAYLDHLDAGRDPAELQEFVNSLTTNLTSLYREAHHFAHLEKHVLAPLSQQTAPRLRIWSAGCSSGEEPASIALTALEAMGNAPADIRILATDLDTGMLARAAAGQYPADRAADIPQRFARHLVRSECRRFVSLPPAAQGMIAYRCLNLLEPWPMTGRFDAVFCRNVMIYFSQPTKAALIDRFAALLTPGGYLYLGHSESILGQHGDLEACGETVYRRRTP